MTMPMHTMYEGEQLKRVQEYFEGKSVPFVMLIGTDGDVQHRGMALLSNGPVPEEIWKALVFRTTSTPVKDCTPEWAAFMDGSVCTNPSKEGGLEGLVYSATHTPITATSVAAQWLMAGLMPWCSIRFPPTAPVPAFAVEHIQRMAREWAGQAGGDGVSDSAEGLRGLGDGGKTLGDVFRLAFAVPVQPKLDAARSSLRARGAVGTTLELTGEEESAMRVAAPSLIPVDPRFTAMRHKLQGRQAMGQAPGEVRVTALVKSDATPEEELLDTGAYGGGEGWAKHFLQMQRDRGRVPAPAPRMPTVQEEAEDLEGYGDWCSYTQGLAGSAKMLALAQPELACSDPHRFAELARTLSTV